MSTERLALLESLLSQVERMYGKEWDTVEGGLWMSPESKDQWDELHRQVRLALGRPLFGDREGDWDE